jgi:hypothetical protein
VEEFARISVNYLMCTLEHGKRFSGTRLQNGTFTDAFGLLQSGVIDMWGSDARVTILRSESFFFTTAVCTMNTHLLQCWSI